MAAKVQESAVVRMLLNVLSVFTFMAIGSSPTVREGSHPYQKKALSRYTCEAAFVAVLS